VDAGARSLPASQATEATDRAAMALPGRVLSVNVARASAVVIDGRRVLTAIGKRAVDGRRALLPLGVEGDEQADPRIHGGPGRAVYAYPSEHYPFWQTVRAQAGIALWDEPLLPGSLGENLTTAGVVETDLFVGDVLRFPQCALAVSAPRLPCFKFNAAMGFKHAAKLMTESAWCGWYLAVREPGTIGAGDAFDINPGPREVSVWELFRARTRRGA
jgi:MOSC domain-containing protein YiiM